MKNALFYALFLFAASRLDAQTPFAKMVVGLEGSMDLQQYTDGIRAHPMPAGGAARFRADGKSRNRQRRAGLPAQPAHDIRRPVRVRAAWREKTREPRYFGTKTIKTAGKFSNSFFFSLFQSLTGSDRTNSAAPVRSCATPNCVAGCRVSSATSSTIRDR